MYEISEKLKEKIDEVVNTIQAGGLVVTFIDKTPYIIFNQMSDEDAKKRVIQMAVGFKHTKLDVTIMPGMVVQKEKEKKTLVQLDIH